MHGTITAVITTRGFGFIRPTGGGGDLFFHCSKLADDLEFNDRLLELDVEFDVATASDGRKRAVNVCRRTD